MGTGMSPFTKSVVASASTRRSMVFLVRNRVITMIVNKFNTMIKKLMTKRVAPYTVWSSVSSILVIVVLLSSVEAIVVLFSRVETVVAVNSSSRVFVDGVVLAALLRLVACVPFDKLLFMFMLLLLLNVLFMVKIYVRTHHMLTADIMLFLLFCKYYFSTFFPSKWKDRQILFIFFNFFLHIIKFLFCTVERQCWTCYIILT